MRSLTEWKLAFLTRNPLSLSTFLGSGCMSHWFFYGDAGDLSSDPRLLDSWLLSHSPVFIFFKTPLFEMSSGNQALSLSVVLVLSAALKFLTPPQVSEWETSLHFRIPYLSLPFYHPVDTKWIKHPWPCSFPELRVEWELLSWASYNLLTLPLWMYAKYLPAHRESCAVGLGHAFCPG